MGARCVLKLIFSGPTLFQTCRHAEAMKNMMDLLVGPKGGLDPKVYLLIFLKFIQVRKKNLYLDFFHGGLSGDRTRQEKKKAVLPNQRCLLKLYLMLPRHSWHCALQAIIPNIEYDYTSRFQFTQHADEDDASSASAASGAN